jgi:hypothetical protein
LSDGSSNGEPITLHDPCYLARVNGEVDATRAVIGATNDAAVSRNASLRKKTFCCGAGGGRMWFEESPAQRVSVLRAQEAARDRSAHRSPRLPVLFEHDDLTAWQATQGGENVKVLDISEVLLSRRMPSR